MKKLLILVFAILILVFSCLYIFIPSVLEISKIEFLSCNAGGASRAISKDSNWERWWKPLAGIGYSCQLTGKFYQGVDLSFKKSGQEVKSKLNLLSFNGRDSIILQWHCSYPTSLNPIERWRQYREALSIKGAMNLALSDMKYFLERKENVYGINLLEIKANDSSLLASKWVSGHYPSTEEIYGHIQEIRNYIRSNGRQEVNHPMLNVTRTTEDRFDAMVAIATDTTMKGNEKIFYKHFVPLKILTAQVRGGVYSVQNAMNEMNLYISDYQRTVMAIPFQLLVTERDQTKDTASWVTTIAQPIF